MKPKTVNTRQEIRESISAAGLKATQPRIVILEAFYDLHDCHPSAEQIYQKLREANPGISLGTIYKTLDSFAEAELIKRVFSNDSRRYDINHHNHGHIYCTNTKEIIDYTDPELEKLMQEFFRQKQFENFNIRNISVQITGSKTDPDKQISIT